MSSKLNGVLQDDHASVYLSSLTEKQRKPQYVTNGLPQSPKTFTKEERAAALETFTPKPEVDKTEK